MLLLMIGIGGAAGAFARYQLSGWVYARSGADFPWGTLAVNVSGSLALGILLPLLGLHSPSSGVRGLIIVGCIGSFTTFSTFAYEALMLLRNGQRVRAVAYVAASLALGLLALVVGLWLGQSFL